MKPEDVKTYYRTIYNFTKQTGMAFNSLKNWIKCGYVPLDSQKKLEALTKGGLKFNSGDYCEGKYKNHGSDS